VIHAGDDEQPDEIINLPVAIPHQSLIPVDRLVDRKDRVARPVVDDQLVFASPEFSQIRGFGGHEFHRRRRVDPGCLENPWRVQIDIEVQHVSDEVVGGDGVGRRHKDVRQRRRAQREIDRAVDWRRPERGREADFPYPPARRADARVVRPVEIEVSLVGVTPKSAAGETLTASKVDSVNSFEASNMVMPKPVSAKVQGGKLALKLEHKSVTVISVEQ
jgi:alpha-L-arabinofuranosidase-like protein